MTNFDDLETPPTSGSFASSSPSRAKPPRPTFTCMSCAGTGRYAGPRVRQAATECFACAGRGYHLQAPGVRKAANAKRKATIETRREERIAALGDLYETMTANAHWCTFFASMLEHIETRDMSEGQLAAVQRTAAKIDAGRAERAAKAAAEQAARSVDIGMSAIEKLFATATANGLRKPIFRTGRLSISPAPAHGRNAGAVYVKDRGEYAGKIVDGRFVPARDAAPDVATILRDIAADPVESARAYGKATGMCCCCGRTLTDPVSVANGIGPICEANWF